MFRPLLPPLALLALAVPAWGQDYDIRKDPQLKKTITLSVKYGPIGDVLKAIGKQEGVSLVATGPIADLKVSVFATDVPGNVLLDRIGSVLDCHWSSEGGLYVLKTTPDDTKMLSKYLAAEDVLLRTKAEDELNQLVTKSAESPLPAGGDTSNSPRYQRRHRGQTQMSMPAQITKIFSDASSSDMDNFWSGEILHFETVDSTPPANADANPPAPTNASKTPDNTTVVYARYDCWGTHQLQFGTSKSPVIPQPFAVPALTLPAENLADTPYGKKLLSWPDMTLTDGEDAFSQPLPPDPDAAIGFKPHRTQDDPRDSAPRRSQSDVLEEFSKRSGIPIVSDGFRTSLPQQGPDPKGTTPLEWLKSFSTQYGNFIQIRDGVAAVRQGGFWRLRQYEIPEDSLKIMEKDPTTLNVGDYAKFFYALTPAQARTFASSTPPVVKFPIDAIIQDIPALRVIGSLGANFPTDGHRVPVTDLGSDTQTLIAEAIAESVFSGDSWQPTAETKKEPFSLTLQPANVSQPEGTVPGITLQFILPIGQTVDYQIPLKLVF